VISIIIASDFLLTTSASLISPIFALFVTQQVSGGTAQVVGFSMAIYWIVKSVLQLPVARMIDRNHGEIDDYYYLLAGMILGAGVMSLYYFADRVWHVYALQAMFGIADAMLVPPFYAIFTRHVDRGAEGFEWSLRSSFSYGGGAALGGALGGLLVALIGYSSIFLVAAAVYLMSAMLLIFLKPYILPKAKSPVERVFVEQKRL
jgi:MFS family permease